MAFPLGNEAWLKNKNVSHANCIMIVVADHFCRINLMVMNEFQQKRVTAINFFLLIINIHP